MYELKFFIMRIDNNDDVISVPNMNQCGKDFNCNLYGYGLCKLILKSMKKVWGILYILINFAFQFLHCSFGFHFNDTTWQKS